MKMGNITEAMALAFEGQKSDKALLWLFLFLKKLGPFKRSLNPLSKAIRTMKKGNFRKYSRDHISYFELVDLLGWGTWGDYLKQRFSCSSFWDLYPFIPIVKGKNEMVFDFLCGAGHGSYVISRNAKPKIHVCADMDYTLLFIAKKYFAPEAQFLCIDANDPLPLKDDIFSSIIMLDSTHYVSNRGVVGSECQRTVKDDGSLVWLHLHNALSENTSSGFPLSPSQWSNLMGHMGTTILPEDRVINQYMEEKKLDLKANYSESEINSSGALCIVGTKDEGIIRAYDNIEYPSLESVGTAMINPIYEFNSQGSGIRLTRTDVNKIYRTEYPLTFKYLPPSYSIQGNLSRYFQGRYLKPTGSLTSDDKRKLDEMLKKFLIIQAPEKYL